MNTWYEIQVRTTSHGWSTVADVDTDVEADAIMEEYKILDDEQDYRVRVRSTA